MFKGIGFYTPEKYAKEHKNILEQFYGSYDEEDDYAKSSLYNQIFFHMQELYEEFKTPLVGEISQAKLRQYLDNDFFLLCSCIKCVGV